MSIIHSACATVLISLCLFFSSFVDAEESCPSLPRVDVNPSLEQWLVVRDRLGAVLDKCLNSPSYFALYGAALMHTSNLSQAIEMLERALLLSPENGGALLDYSTALYHSGELMTALAINESLLEREDTPRYLIQLLQQRQADWEAEKVNWRGRFALLGGYHDNLNGVADLDNIILTLEDEDLLVFLGNNSTPLEGGYISSRLSAQRTHLLADGHSVFSMAFQDRSTELTSVDTDELTVGYERIKQLHDGKRSWRLESSYLLYGDRELYFSLEGGGERHWSVGRCSPFVELELRTLYFPELDYLNEASFMYGGGVSCGGSANQLVVGAYAIYNASLNNREGGDRLGGEVEVKWQRLLGGGVLLAQLSYSPLYDQEGYSPLLRRNEERDTQDISASLQYIYPISRSFSLHAGFYHRNLESNLDLFETSASNIDVGLSVSF